MAKEKEVQSEDKVEVKKQPVAVVYAVVPKVEARELVDNKDGTTYQVLTIEEALSEIVNKIRKIEKAVA